MKRYQQVCVALGLMALFAQGVVADAVIPTTGNNVIPGEWSANQANAFAFAEEQGIPLLIVSGNANCKYCKAFNDALATSEFIEWRQERKMAMLYVKDDRKLHDLIRIFTNPDTGKPVTLTELPLVMIYWVQNGQLKVDRRFTGRAASMPVKGEKGGTLAAQFINSVEKYVSDYQYFMDDQWDPDDNVRSGAQMLEFSKVPQSQAHTLKHTDTNDWFTFTVAPGSTNLVSLTDVESAGGTPLFQVFDGAATTASDSGTVTEGKSFQFANTSGAPTNVTLRVYYSSGANVDIAYTINYKEYVPSTVWFESTNMTFNASEGTFVVPVTRGGENAALKAVASVTIMSSDMHTRYSLDTSILDWAGVENDKTNLVIMAAADDTWIGNQTFTLSLTPVGEETVDPFQEAIITIDAGLPKVGTVAYTGYVVNGNGVTNNYLSSVNPAVREGDTVTVLLSRTGGSNMAVTAGLAWPSASGGPIAGAEAFWDDTEEGVRGVDIVIPASSSFVVSRTLALTLDPVDNAAAAAKAKTLTFRVYNAFYAGALTQFVAANPAVPLVTTSDNWFLTDGGNVRSRPLASGATAAMTAALTGPGVLSFAVAEGSAGMTLSVKGKSTVQKPVQLGGDEYGYIIPEGKQTVTLTATSVTGDSTPVYAVLSGLSYVPLTAAVTAVSPIAGDVVQSDSIKLLWNATGAGQLAGINGITNSYTVFTGATEKALAQVADLEAGSTSYELSSGAALGAFVWRVGISVSDADSTITLNGAAQKITVVGSGAASFDMDSGAINPSWVLDADAAQLTASTYVGLRTAFGAFPVTGATVVKVKSGSLPSGMSLVNDGGTWWVSGIPTKVAANARVVLQAMNGKDGGTTFALNYTILPLPREAYGTFSGTGAYYQTPFAMGYGLSSLTVSASGKISGKVTVQSLTYSFSAAGYDAFDGDVFVVTNALFVAKYKKETVPLKLQVNPALPGMAQLGAPDGSGYPVLSGALYRDGWSDSSLAPEREEALRLALNYDSGVLSKAPGGYYTVALPLHGGDDAGTGLLGTGYLTLTVDKKGKVKTSGKLADGTSVSMSSTLAMPSTTNLNLYLLNAPKAYQGGLLLTIMEFGRDSLTGRILLDGEAFWSNQNPKATSTGGFALGLDVVGGWYSKTDSLIDMYASDGWFAKAQDWEVSVAPNAKGTGFAALPSCGSDDNPACLKLSVKTKTGLFSGSFTETVPGVKKPVTRKLEGVLTPTLTDADGLGGISGMGFYLLPQTTPHKFNLSGDFVLEPDCGCLP